MNEEIEKVTQHHYQALSHSQRSSIKSNQSKSSGPRNSVRSSHLGTPKENKKNKETFSNHYDNENAFAQVQLTYDQSKKKVSNQILKENSKKKKSNPIYEVSQRNETVFYSNQKKDSSDKEDSYEDLTELIPSSLLQYQKKNQQKEQKYKNISTFAKYTKKLWQEKGSGSLPVFSDSDTTEGFNSCRSASAYLFADAS